MKFYLGTHMANWLGGAQVPLFISRRRLFERKRLPQASAPWALDSGGFTELNLYGCWSLTPEKYVGEVRRYRDEIGSLDFAAPMDWMCEPFVTAKTGKSVAEHQRLTVENYLDLRDLDPDLPFIPVLQGYTLDDYLRCIDLYMTAGVALDGLVGLGTICRRQSMAKAEVIVRRLEREGISLHGFGVKVTGLRSYGDALASSDSMAWSYRARKERPGSCGLKSCSNCLHYALDWRADLIERAPDSHQLPMEVAV